MNCRLTTRSTVIGICLLAFSSSQRGLAQKAAPLAKPNPLAPSLDVIFPAGMQRGTTKTLTLTGDRLQDATQLLVDFPAKISLLPDPKNKSGSSLRVKIAIPENAPVGPFVVYVATKHGISNPRLFCIDDLPQVVEESGNHEQSKAQKLDVPCVVSGRIESQQSDYYRISAKRGAKISLDLIGRRLGNPSDPQLTVYSAPTFRELVHANDSPGCQTDPRITFTVPEDGDYLLRVRDLLFRGGSEYVYQFRIGDFPCATAPVPMAVKAGHKTEVGFAGPYIDNAKPVPIVIPNEPELQTTAINPVNGAGRHGWPVTLGISSHAETAEKEPNDEPATANDLSLPSGVTGRFLKQDDTDIYRFKAKKGQKIRIQAHTMRFHSPTLVYMRVLNDKANKAFEKTNPQASPPADQRIDFTPPADGVYLLEVQHLNYIGGPEQVYRVTMEPIQPDFDLAFNLDRFDVARGSIVPLNISVDRRGYNGPIDLRLQSDGPFTGQGKIAAGQKEGLVLVRCTGDEKQPLTAHFITVVAEASINGRKVKRTANTRAAMSDALADLRFPPHSLIYRAALAVRVPGPFRLTAKLKAEKHHPGSTAVVTVSVTREKKFTGPISLIEIAGLPDNVKAPKKLPSIAKGKSDASFNVALPSKTRLGNFPLVVTGEGKIGKKTYTEHSTAAALVIERQVKKAPPPKRSTSK